MVDNHIPAGGEVVLKNGKLKHTERGMPIQSNLRKRTSLLTGLSRTTRIASSYWQNDVCDYYI